MKTDALSELMEELKLLFDGRYFRKGFKLPVLWSTDDSCTDRTMLQRMSRELEDATGVSLYLGDELSSGVQPERLPMLELEFQPSVVYAQQAVADACGSLRQNVYASMVEGEKVLGVDAEWEIGPSGRKKVATIQIAPLRSTPFVFHLQRGESGFKKETFPATLKALLEDSSIIKTGVAINADATHVLSDYGVAMANTVDLRTVARSNLVVTSSRTLAGMTACPLGKQLPKDTVRFSRWGGGSLSDSQRDYAARDAVASVVMYDAMFKNKDPITAALSQSFDPTPGSKVRLYNASHSACVAVANVVSDSTSSGLAPNAETTKAHGPSTTLGIVLALLSVPCPRTNDAEIRRRFSVWGQRRKVFPPCKCFVCMGSYES